MGTDVDGLLNLRDLGGTPTRDGRTVLPGRLWRSENQTRLTDAALQRLVDLGLTDVIDLRTDFEVTGSPSPFRDRPGVRYHHHSYFREADTEETDLIERALPWLGYRPGVLTGDPTTDSYLAFLSDRPDSVLGALRAIADASGAALVHCAVGKDRTGMTVALALSLVDVDDAVIAADYARTTDSILEVARLLWTDPTYAAESDRVPRLEELAARPEAMLGALGHLREAHGGVRPLLHRLGWTDADNARLRRHLLG